MTDHSEEVSQSKLEEKSEAESEKLKLKMSGGSTVKRVGRRGRRPSKVDVKVKLERSRQSARECRARKKLRYQYLEELVNNREKAVYALRSELEQFRKWCQAIDRGEIPEGIKKALATFQSSVKLVPTPKSKSAVSHTATRETSFKALVDVESDTQECNSSSSEDGTVIPTLVNTNRRIQHTAHVRQLRPKKATNSAIVSATKFPAIPTIVASHRTDNQSVVKQGQTQKQRDFHRQIFSIAAAMKDIQSVDASASPNTSGFSTYSHSNEEDISAGWTQDNSLNSFHVDEQIPSNMVSTRVWPDLPGSSWPSTSNSSPSFTTLLNSNGIEDSSGWTQDGDQIQVPLDMQQLMASAELVLGGAGLLSEETFESPQTSPITNSLSVSSKENSL